VAPSIASENVYSLEADPHAALAEIVYVPKLMRVRTSPFKSVVPTNLSLMYTSACGKFNEFLSPTHIMNVLAPEDV
jgi:hypothetical protein